MYSTHMRLLPFLWFSMKLGVINSFLVVCVTMVQKIFKNAEFSQKYHSMAIKQYLRKNALLLQQMQERKKNWSNNFPAI